MCNVLKCSTNKITQHTTLYIFLPPACFLLFRPPSEERKSARMVKGSKTERGGGRWGRRSQEVGAWLFPEIGLAATLHLHCRDRGGALA